MRIDFSKLEQEIRDRGNITPLSNGATVITERVPNSGLAMGDLVIEAGSSVEERDHEGAMHMVEHLSFSSGSILHPDRNERNKVAHKLGVQQNAATGQHSITYFVRGDNPTNWLLRDDFSSSLRFVASLAFAPVFTEDVLELEKKIVLRERTERESREQADAFQNLQTQIHRTVYANNPSVNRPPIGTEASINALSLPILKEYHSRFFVGSNLTANIIGDLDKKTIGTIHDTLGQLPKGDMARASEFLAERPYQGREVVTLPSPHPQTAYVSMFFHIPPAHRHEAAAINLAASMLVGPDHGLLFQDLRWQKGLVYSVGVHFEGHSSTGVLNLQYSVSPDQLERSLGVVDENLNRLREGNFPSELLESYKRSNLTAALAELQIPGWIKSELMARHDKERHGYESTPISNLQTRVSLSKKDVMGVAQKYIGENRLTVLCSNS
jgi:predicted Zn-dependent peptidase